MTTVAAPLSRPVEIAKPTPRWRGLIAIALWILLALILIPQLHRQKSEFVLSFEQKHLFQEQMSPLIQALHEKDQQAATALKQAVRNDFKAWRVHIPDFVEDMNGLGSQLALMTMYAVDGKDITDSAVQATFDEMVVSPQEQRSTFQSHMYAFTQQITDNRTAFLHNVMVVLKRANLSSAWKNNFEVSLVEIRRRQVILLSHVGISTASAPILSMGGAYLSERVATWILKRLPASTGTALLLKGFKLNLVTGIIFFMADFAISDYVNHEMVEALEILMHQNEQVVLSKANHYANELIQANENGLVRAIKTELARR